MTRFDHPGCDPSRDREIAAMLMRMALALLDRAGDPTFATPRLQHALDSLVPPTSVISGEGDEDLTR